MHEVKTRGRGGDPTNPANILCVCRACHDWITTHPAEAAALDLVRHFWDTEDRPPSET